MSNSMGINFNQISVRIIYCTIRIGQIIVAHIIANEYTGLGALGFFSKTNQIYKSESLIYFFYFSVFFDTITDLNICMTSLSVQVSMYWF